MMTLRRRIRTYLLVALVFCTMITGIGMAYVGHLETMKKVQYALDGKEALALQANTLPLVVLVLFVLASIALAMILGKKMSQEIVLPIDKIQERMVLLAEGDLDSPTYQHDKEDELGILTQSFEQAISMIKEYVDEINRDLLDMAQGNFDIDTTHSYKGSFKRMGDALMQIHLDLNRVFHEIRQAADQVASGSQQVATGAQGLSQGATEQAGTIEQLSASITLIADQIKGSAASSSQASQLVMKVSQELEDGNHKMNEMVAAMKNISAASDQIARIIRTIDDIAFQTNILSLNAAVEAARAGAAGKGFAVVADEVRNLAGKSAQAVEETSRMIDNILEVVGKGENTANMTAKAILDVVEGARSIYSLVEEISKASGEQAVAIGEINQGVEQVSVVVQSNSATSEESAAASEELSSQAMLLKDRMARFDLKNLESEDYGTLTYDTYEFEGCEGRDEALAEPVVNLSYHPDEKYR